MNSWEVIITSQCYTHLLNLSREHLEQFVRLVIQIARGDENIFTAAEIHSQNLQLRTLPLHGDFLLLWRVGTFFSHLFIPHFFHFFAFLSSYTICNTFNRL